MVMHLHFVTLAVMWRSIGWEYGAEENGSDDCKDYIFHGLYRNSWSSGAERSVPLHFCGCVWC
jgi:hypothetical protein